ncbi:MAG: NAD(P)-binding protein [Candidatus Lokiarchaeota archaeon]|nr:NAD(P)-binding protein [Candidatus Lokiarchaeota archaeon]
MKLLESYKINNIELKNRICMPAMDTNFGNRKGELTEKNKKYLELRAKGGVGLIITEPAFFENRGRGTGKMLSIAEDDKIEGFKQLTEKIHKHGSRILLQLYHAGNQATSFFTGEQPVSCSNIPCGLTGEIPKPLSIEEINEIVQKYAIASLRAKKAGFDGVEIHAGHGYLLNQFLSNRTNKRNDQYGGNLENRMRILIEVLKAVREKVGNEFIICFRLNGDDYIENGLEIEDTVNIAKALEDNGVDLLNISAGVFDSEGFPTVPYMNYPRGVFVPYAERIKENLSSTPVCVVGRINTPELAENILQENKADLIAIGRGLIGDPKLPIKIKNGDFKSIRKCIGCNSCIDKILADKGVKCAINPHILHFADDLKKSNDPKKVLIVGAGPAGLEAARICSIRGHDITLIEEDDKIGGFLHLAAAAPMKTEVNNLIEYYNYILNKMNINILLNTCFNKSLLNELKPEIIILATGTEPIIPPIQGLDESEYILFNEVLNGKVPEGNIIAIIGGGMVGVEVAEYLLDKNKSVVIIEMLKRLGSNVPAMVAKEIIPRIENHPNITTYLNTKIAEIKNHTLIGKMKGKSEPVSIEFDDLIIATGSKPNNNIEKQIDSSDIKVYKIGDCKKPRKIINATADAFKVAMKI